MKIKKLRKQLRIIKEVCENQEKEMEKIKKEREEDRQLVKQMTKRMMGDLDDKADIS